MNWQTELNDSFLWILTALFWLSFILTVAAFALKKTQFGQKFWLITQPCVNSGKRWKILGLIFILLILILLEVRISVLNTFFYNGLYSALQNKDADGFWFFATINAMLVLCKIIHSIINYLMRQVFEIRWLEKLNQTMLRHWLDNKNYYRLKYENDLPDNIDQRIEQDAREFITGTVDLVRGVINSIVSTIEFTLILWQLSGILLLFSVAVPKGVVFFIYIFILLSTALSIWIGYPLIKLNFNKEKLNGDYRYSLIRVRDQAESIAFYHGEENEKHHLSEKFQKTIQNRWQIVYKMLGLDGFNTGVTQVAMLLPLMLQAPRFFAGQVTLGDMHQTVQSFNRLMRALSFFRLFYEEFTLYQARLNRLAGFLQRVNELSAITAQATTLCEIDHFRLQNFGIRDEQNRTLLRNINLQLQRGDYLLIRGASGSGKTSLLKAIAGIYPFKTEGTVQQDCRFTRMFIPQMPYIPEGTLKEAICYPNIQATDQQIMQAMQHCKLERYLYELETECDWQVLLSPGEMQRIAFIRILLAKPDVIFLDETTSALDELNEQIMYLNLKRYLPHSIVISVGHRSTLQQFHNRTLRL
ncbi:ABC transporter ATP-binding protein/permease [Testudinibacter sp. TR-2022]|uniref:ABC transporter ATP-binding protein/permease n=1 Tax=Testudinibacter sp. TR-2022 TaxID=2585029 RepID=UPI001118E2B5|nr:ABC transporter ATP-binding protein/permease [Testudinibacter sp. TR-2022]TNH07320.1 ABC transporter ATP-binding protein/permease [Pasteurellaceae bacterium Phil11]TNH22393.1 ABC transporter ATP-binding protein/permease [Testudinibacter sp. TR-2022]TNH29017.1 ABC transporter ATP-binding protein/permease [Testudinibacter sp. TR-2022]